MKRVTRQLQRRGVTRKSVRQPQPAQLKKWHREETCLAKGVIGWATAEIKRAKKKRRKSCLLMWLQHGHVGKDNLPYGAARIAFNHFWKRRYSLKPKGEAVYLYWR